MIQRSLSRWNVTVIEKTKGRIPVEKAHMEVLIEQRGDLLVFTNTEEVS
jgi:hypothetical protein